MVSGATPNEDRGGTHLRAHVLLRAICDELGVPHSTVVMEGFTIEPREGGRTRITWRSEAELPSTRVSELMRDYLDTINHHQD